MEKLAIDLYGLFSKNLLLRNVKSRFCAAAGVSTLLLASTLLVSPIANAAIVTSEYGQFFLQYDDAAIGAFGTPIVGGNTVFFLPTDMSVELEEKNSYLGVREASNGPWTTSFAVIPKLGYSLSSVTLTEEGDYSHSLDTVYEDEYEVTARLFVRDINNPSSSEFHQFDYQFGEDEETSFALWNNSETYSTANFAAGYWLTVQNTLSLTEQSGFLEGPDEGGFTGDMAGMYLQKKYVGFDIAIVPIPAAAWFMLSALSVLAFASRRQNKR